MKKVLFDGLAIQSKQPGLFHGGGEYAKFILREAIKAGYIFDIIFCKKLYTDPLIHDLLHQNPEIKVFDVDDKSDVYDIIDKGNYDCFFSALPNIYSNFNSRTPLFGVIHGLRSIELPWDFFRYKYAKKPIEKLKAWLISHCERIQDRLKQKHIALNRRILDIKGAKYIVVSQHTKYSVLSFFPHLKPEDILVFYSPFEIEDPHENVKKENYYLMVSGNRYEKNTYRAILAFDKLFSAGWLKDKKVKITGFGGMKLWNEVKNKNRFELLPYVSTEELNRLYEHAFCFVYPSLNEGFGYPPLKAMGYGTPVVASSATSIPEVCGDAASFFSPTNIDDMANRILRIDLDEEFREEMVTKGKRRVTELLNKQDRDMPLLLNLLFNK